MIAVIVGSVTDIIDDLNMDRRNFQEKIDAVKNYMEMVNVNKSLQERVIKWFNHSWMNNSGMDEQLIFQQYKSTSRNSHKYPFGNPEKSEYFPRLRTRLTATTGHTTQSSSF